MKILLGIIFLFVLIFSPVAVFAVEGDSCTTNAECGTGFICSGGLCVNESKLPDTSFRLGTTEEAPSSGSEILGRIGLIANWVFAIFLAISLIYILLAAFQFVTGGGDPAQVSGARQKLIYALIGIAIALMAAGFPAILRSIVT
ncbi:hypothetical protein IH982_02380 [Patescibacteria group bacterium]|nr:hypothetical protein [Patescibacteria group bacterium]